MEQPFKRRRVAGKDFTDEELQHQKAYNDLRLKSAFECIFEKYGKDFTGIGDEIDLETGKIVVNRGHISGLSDEKYPGREEDLYDELDGETWSGENRATTGHSHVRPRNMIPAFKNSMRSGLRTETRDPFEPAHETDSLMGDMVTESSANAADEIAGLSQNKPLSNPGAHPPNCPAQAVQNENSIEPIWCAPPLPNKVSTCQENLQPQDFLIPDAYEDPPMSPPGKSLWGPSKGGKKHQVARRKDTITPLSKPSGLPLSPIKQTHSRRSMMSLSYEWSEISFNQTSEPDSTALPIMTPKASPTICKSVGSLHWTKYEDHKLYYLKSEAGMTYSQLAAAFPGRSETEIEDRWLDLYLAENNSLVRGARYEKDMPIHSIKTSDVADCGNASSSTHCRPVGDQNSPKPLETRPLQLFGTAKEQISPVKPRDVEQIPSTDPKGRHDSSKIPKPGTTMDLAIDLTWSAGEEATTTADFGCLTENPKHKSKQGESAANQTPGILKRVTRKPAAVSKVKERPLINIKGAIAGHETDADPYLEMPEAQNQAFSDSVSQQVPSPKTRSQKKTSMTRANRRKQLALNLGAPKVHIQKPSTPMELVTPPLEISTDVSPSSPVATRSSRSSQNLEVNNINPDSYSSQNKESPTRYIRSKSSINTPATAKAQSTDSISTGRRRNVPSDGGKSKSDQLCMKCSAKITIDGEGNLGGDLLCSICFSRISHRSCSVERPTPLSETDCRKDTPHSSNHTDLRSRDDSEDRDCLLEAQPLNIITPAGVRPQKLSLALSPTPTHAKVVKMALRTRVIDNLSDDELSMPVQISRNLVKHANTSRKKFVLV